MSTAAEFGGSVHPIVGPIDTVAVKMPAGYNMMSIDEWQALDRDQRFALIKAQRVVFLRAGVSVPIREALLWLSERSGGNG